MKENILENISSIIQNSQEMLIIGFVDKKNIVDNLISRRLKAILDSLEIKIKLLEYDAELILDNCTHFNVITLPSYNVYYNNILLEQFDLMDTSYEIKKKLSQLIIN